MKYNIKTDDNGYITEIRQDEKGIEIEITEQFLSFMTCYKLSGTNIVLDQEKMNSMIMEEQKENRVAEIINELERTDYVQDEFIDSLLSLNNPVTFITDILALISKMTKDYPQIIAKRKELIVELKSLI